MDIEFEGFDEYDEVLNNMILSPEDKKKAIRKGITVIAENLEKDTPSGPSGELAEIKTKVKDEGLYIEGEAASKAFYDIFQNFGTSEQKAHIGYFDNSVDKSTEEAIEAVGEIVLGKIK